VRCTPSLDRNSQPDVEIDFVSWFDDAELWRVEYQNRVASAEWVSSEHTRHRLSRAGDRADSATNLQARKARCLSNQGDPWDLGRPLDLPDATNPNPS
jgi:hypothetical protein